MSWIVDSKGVIFSDNKVPEGYFDINGEVYNKEAIAPYGLLTFPPLAPSVGFVDINGDTYNSSHLPIGFVDIEGSIYDVGHLLVATIDQYGTLSEKYGIFKANINLELHKKHHNLHSKPMPYRAAAALYFLILHRK